MQFSVVTLHDNLELKCRFLQHFTVKAILSSLKILSSASGKFLSAGHQFLNVSPNFACKLLDRKHKFDVLGYLVTLDTSPQVRHIMTKGLKQIFFLSESVRDS